MVFAAVVASCGGSTAPTSATPSTGSTSPSIAPTVETASPVTAPPVTAPPVTAPTVTEPPAPAPLAAPVVTSLGDPEIVFDWSEDRCSDDMRPDLPVRVFERSDGNLVMTLSDPQNFVLVGADLDSLAPVCPAVLVSGFDPDPAAYDHFEWFGAVYTDDGETVHAIVHNEYHGHEAAVADWARDAHGGPSAAAWTAFGRAGGDLTPLDPNSDGWRLGESLCSIGFWGMHPDVGCDALRRWTAPVDGSYTITLSVSDANAGGGDGVVVGVDHAGAPLWSTEIDDGAPDPVDVVLNIDASAGDPVDVWVAARGDASFDATGIVMQIDLGEPKCPSRQRMPCQQVSLTSATSTDGGRTWVSADAPGHLVATVPEVYRPDAGFVAMWQPSNIVRHPVDGYFYMLVQYDWHRDGTDVQGTCLVRTATIDQPGSWRAWDGDAFDMTLPDPYTTPDLDPEAHTCTSVVEAPIGGLTYNTALEAFVAAAGYNYEGVSGNYLRVSRDLIEWSEPVLVNAAEFVWTGDGVPPYDGYATLIDPASESRSFDTTGATPYLYFSRFNSSDPRDYDLIRIPLRLEPG